METVDSEAKTNPVYNY